MIGSIKALSLSSGLFAVMLSSGRQLDQERLLSE